MSSGLLGVPLWRPFRAVGHQTRSSVCASPVLRQKELLEKFRRSDAIVGLVVTGVDQTGPMASITGFEPAGTGPGDGGGALAALRRRLRSDELVALAAAGSGVADVAAAVALADAGLAIDELFAAGVDPEDSRDAVVWIEELERLGRRVDAARSALVERIQSKVLHTADGHGSAKIMVRHVARLTEAEALAR